MACIHVRIAFAVLKFIQLYIVATVWMHSDAIFSFIIASQMKIFIRSQCLSINCGSL